MNIMDIPSSSMRLCNRSMICACTVVSNAVVGSSAMSIVGSQARAIAHEYTLAHPTGQFERKGTGDPIRGRNPDSGKQFAYSFGCNAFGDLVMYTYEIAELSFDAHHWVQRGSGVLGDHRNVSASKRGQRTGRSDMSNCRPSKTHLSMCRQGAFEEAEYGVRRH